MTERKNRTILLVDDDRQIVEMLPPFLSQYGYHSVAVESADKELRELLCW